MIYHRKTSTIDDSSAPADAVKGNDWNDMHRLGIGTIVILGVLKISFDASGAVVNVEPRGMGDFVHVSAGIFTAAYSAIPAEALGPGTTANYFCSLQSAGWPAAMDNWSIDASVSSSTTATIAVTNSTGAAADPGGKFDVYLTVHAIVVQATVPS